MLPIKDNISDDPSKIWIISEGRSSDINLKEMLDGKVDGPYKEFRISDIGHYLLNPHSIEVKKRLIGGEIHYKQGALKKVGKFLRKILPGSAKRRKNGAQQHEPEILWG